MLNQSELPLLQQEQAIILLGSVPAYSIFAPISLSAFVHKLLSGMLHVSSIRGSVRKMRIYNDKEIPN
jgi:hypothetical protein